MSGVADGSGSSTITVDASGRLSTVNGVAASYDAAGRALLVPLPDGTVVDYSYDARGLATQIVETAPGGGLVEPVEPVEPAALSVCDSITATITGTSGDDTLIGTPGDDVINGRGGNDIINGRGGNDIICGRGGDDTIVGGTGADVIVGGNGRDTLDGSAGRDQVFGSVANDTILASDGQDTLIGGPGNDTIDGGNGADTIFGSAGNDTIDGGANADTVVGGDGDDSIFGGTGPDVIFGSAGVDNLRGNGGPDTIDGGPDADRIRGNGGTDLCETDVDVQGCEGPLPASGGGSTTWTRTYDGDRRLTAVTSTDGTGTDSWELTWDMAMGVPEIQSWETSAGVTNFVYGNELIGLTDPTGTTGVFAMSPLGDTVETPTTVGYAVADTPGPYGQTDTASVPLFGFSGELQLGTQVHLRARDLTPDLARFNTSDPLDGVNGTPTVASLYAYANNNPTNLTDPQGLRAAVDAGIGETVRFTMNPAACSGQLTRDPDGTQRCTNDRGLLAVAVEFGTGAVNENVVRPFQTVGRGFGVLFTDPGALNDLWDDVSAGAGAYYEEYGWTTAGVLITEALQDIFVDPAIACFNPNTSSYDRGAGCVQTLVEAAGVAAFAKPRIRPNAPTSALDDLPGLPSSAPKPLGLGSTGRVTPSNLTEQLAMTEEGRLQAESSLPHR